MQKRQDGGVVETGGTCAPLPASATCVLQIAAPPITLLDMGIVKAREYKPKRWQVFYSYPDPFTGKTRQWFIYTIKYHDAWIPINSSQLADQVRAILNKELSDSRHQPWHYQKKFGNILAFDVQAKKYLDYINDREKRGLIKPEYTQKCHQLFNERFIPFFGQMDVTMIKAVHLDDLMRSMPKTWKPKTLKNALDALKSFLKRLEALEVIHKVPAFPDLGTLPKPSIDWVNEKAQAEIFNAIPQKHRAFYLVMAAHGMRPGETRALQKGDIRFAGEYGSINIRRAFSDNRLFETPKDKESRSVPINPSVRAMLEEHCRKLVGDKTFLFIDPDTGKPYLRKKTYDVWKAAAKKGGYDIDLYRGVRTSFISQMAQSGKDIQAVSAAAGHSTLEMTQHYFKMQTEPTGKLLYGKKSVVEFRKKEGD